MPAFGLFYFLTALVLFFALMVVLSRNPIYSVIYLIATFFAIFGHYLLLQAEFLAFVHLIVYAGAIMVLFLYTIMMLNLNREAEAQKSNLSKVAAAMAAGLLFVVLAAALRKSALLPGTSVQTGALGSVQNLGMTLFSEFLLPFEVSSLLFLVAMIGAVMLGKRTEAEEGRSSLLPIDLALNSPSDSRNPLSIGAPMEAAGQKHSAPMNESTAATATETAHLPPPGAG